MEQESPPEELLNDQSDHVVREALMDAAVARTMRDHLRDSLRKPIEIMGRCMTTVASREYAFVSNQQSEEQDRRYTLDGMSVDYEVDKHNSTVVFCANQVIKNLSNVKMVLAHEITIPNYTRAAMLYEARQTVDLVESGARLTA